MKILKRWGDTKKTGKQAVDRRQVATRDYIDSFIYVLDMFLLLVALLYLFVPFLSIPPEVDRRGSQIWISKCLDIEFGGPDPRVCVTLYESYWWPNFNLSLMHFPSSYRLGALLCGPRPHDFARSVDKRFPENICPSIWQPRKHYLSATNARL